VAVCLLTRTRARLDELALRAAPLAGADAAAQCAEEGAMALRQLDIIGGACWPTGPR
jgi:hypothetical protein